MCFNWLRLRDVSELVPESWLGPLSSLVFVSILQICHCCHLCHNISLSPSLSSLTGKLSIKQKTRIIHVPSQSFVLSWRPPLTVQQALAYIWSDCLVVKSFLTRHRHAFLAWQAQRSIVSIIIPSIKTPALHHSHCRGISHLYFLC